MFSKATFRKSVSAHQAVSQKRLVLTSRVGESASSITITVSKRLARSCSGARDPSLQEFAFSVKKMLEER